MHTTQFFCASGLMVSRPGTKKRPLWTTQAPVLNRLFKNGAKETRTPDPLHAMQVLYQLSYGPMISEQALSSLR